MSERKKDSPFISGHKIFENWFRIHKTDPTRPALIDAEITCNNTFKNSKEKGQCKLGAKDAYIIQRHYIG
jgi:hypothetical protein